MKDLPHQPRQANHSPHWLIIGERDIEPAPQSHQQHPQSHQHRPQSHQHHPHLHVTPADLQTEINSNREDIRHG